jgi:hypothetical protein
VVDQLLILGIIPGTGIQITIPEILMAVEIYSISWWLGREFYIRRFLAKHQAKVIDHTN